MSGIAGGSEQFSAGGGGGGLVKKTPRLYCNSRFHSDSAMVVAMAIGVVHFISAMLI